MILMKLFICNIRKDTSNFPQNWILEALNFCCLLQRSKILLRISRLVLVSRCVNSLFCFLLEIANTSAITVFSFFFCNTSALIKFDIQTTRVFGMVGDWYFFHHLLWLGSNHEIVEKNPSWGFCSVQFAFPLFSLVTYFYNSLL